MRGGYSDVMMSEMVAVKVLLRSPNAMVSIIACLIGLIAFIWMIINLITTFKHRRRSQRKVHTMPRPQGNNITILSFKIILSL